MHKLILSLVLFVSTFTLTAQNEFKNLSLQSNLGFDQGLSDIWGYTDEEGREYALVGLRSAVAIVDITEPTNPVLISQIEGPTSTWRDIKTFEDHAYVITDQTGSGLHVLDLSNLPNPLDSTDTYFWSPVLPELDSTQLRTCHNLFIEEATGVAYLAGCNVNGGGIFLVDVTNGDSLEYISALNRQYSHDVFVRNDTVYSSAINQGVFTIEDATDRANTQVLAAQSTPFNFTHNAWLSDNGKVLFTTDERRNAPVGAYDISDLADIKKLDEFRPIKTEGQGLIPHNVHVLDDYLVTSFYKEGVIITDASRPDNLIEVGFYDTNLDADVSGFGGSWGAYPYFPSGLVVASDTQNGLFVFEPTYIRAAYLEGMVVDAFNGMPLTGVQVQILSEDPNRETSNADGGYKTGQVTPGTFMVEFSKTGYETTIAEAVLSNGVLTILNAELTRIEVSFEAESLSCDSLSLFFNPNFEDFDTYNWTFIGGTPATSSEVNPIVSFDSSGTTTVSLEVRDEVGTLVASIERQVAVMNSPNANFTTALNGRELTLTNRTINGDRFVWKFGDGNNSEEESPTHIYETGGTFTIELTAFNNCGGVTTSQTVVVNTTSLEDLGILQKFEVQPNPFTSSTTISYQLNSQSADSEIVVRDVLGRMVEKHQELASNGYVEIGKNLQKGVYFAHLTMDNKQSRILKIVKQ